jgi:hypothetical protein
MIAELQFLLAYRADIDAYRTQPFVTVILINPRIKIDCLTLYTCSLFNFVKVENIYVSARNVVKTYSTLISNFHMLMSNC